VSKKGRFFPFFSKTPKLTFFIFRGFLGFFGGGGQKAPFSPQFPNKPVISGFFKEILKSLFPMFRVETMLGIRDAKSSSTKISSNRLYR